jgi:hypothetical protein
LLKRDEAHQVAEEGFCRGEAGTVVFDGTGAGDELSECFAAGGSFDPANDEAEEGKDRQIGKCIKGRPIFDREIDQDDEFANQPGEKEPPQ